MTISYCGNRKNVASDGKCFNTENHIALTLEKLGHEVKFIQEDELNGRPQLPLIVRNSNLFLWTRTWPGKVSIDDLAIIQAMKIPTVSFHLDKYTGLERDGGIGIDPFWMTDYVFSPEGSEEAKKVFRSHGINQYYLPAGVFEDECYLAEPEIKYMHDIVFVGGGSTYGHPEWPYRAKLVKWLEDTYGSRFKKYGYPEETIRGAELNKLYASCKIVIGDSLCKDFTDEYYFSDRVFETTGRGGFMIHPYIKGLEDYFHLEEDIITYEYNNFNQLKEKIDWYLEHEDVREVVRLNGYLQTKKKNTYTHRMKQMLKVLKNEGAI